MERRECMIPDLLLNFFKKEESRRPAVIKYILKNKLTSSNIYWGLKYQILDYRGVFLTMDEKWFDSQIEKFIQEGILEGDKKQGLVLTDLGEKKVKSYSKKHYKLRKPGLFIKYRVNLLNDLMLLLFQILSELKYQNKKYYVASDNLEAQYYIKYWIKKFYSKKAVEFLKKFLIDFLEKYPEKEASIFMAGFVGNNFYGFTNSQIKSKFNVTDQDIYLVRRDILLNLAEELLNSNTDFAKLINVTLNNQIIPESALETLNYLKSGKKIDEICKLRNLKRSTVEEHTVLLACLDEMFDFNIVISSDEIKWLQKIFLDVDVSQVSYAQLKEKISDFPFYKFRIYQIWSFKNNE